MPALRRAAGFGPFRVDGDRVLHPDGTVSAVIGTDELDVEALDASRRAAVLSLFSRMCQALDSPLQLLVRVRPLATPEVCEPDATPRLEAYERAMRAHWATHTADPTVHERRVSIAVRAPAMEGLDSAVERILTCTRRMSVGGHRLGGDDLMRSVRPGDTGLVAWSVHPQYAIVDGVHVSAFALRRFPGHPVGVGWLAPLLRTHVECDIAIHLTPVPLAAALHSLGRRLRDVSAHRLLEAERGSIGDVHVDIALDSAFTLRGRLARNVARALQLSLTVTVRAPSLDELRRRSALVRSAMHATMITCEPAHFRHLAAYITTLPLACDALGTRKLVESTAAVTCVPWLEAGVADVDGYRLGATLRSRTPVRIAPFDTAQHANANVAIFAASGHGKSFAMGAIVIEAATRGVPTVIIDPEGEYAHLAARVGGECLALAAGTSTALNVFDGPGGADEAAAGVTELVTIMCGALSEVERACVDAAAREAIRRAAEAGRSPTLSDCVTSLEQTAPRVAIVVRRYCTDGLGALFDRPTSLRLDAQICVVTLVDLPREHVGPATFLVARWLWNLIRSDRRRRHVVFDEVGALCTHAPLRALLVQLARRCRKYGASLVVATQNAQDLLQTDEGRVVATNCGIVLLGGHRPAETAVMQDAFGLTPQQRHFLESASRGEFLLIAGDRRVELAVEVPELHKAALSP